MFSNSQSFAQRVSEQGDPISAWIWAKLRPASQTTLDLLRDKRHPTKLQKKELAENFNELMAMPDVYDDTRFADIELRSETEKLLERVLQKEEERLYLSRLLLEDAYPDELSREREYADEAMALKAKLPADRVLVVGDGVKMQHDITEPIQWLMR